MTIWRTDVDQRIEMSRLGLEMQYTDYTKNPPVVDWEGLMEADARISKKEWDREADYMKREREMMVEEIESSTKLRMARLEMESNMPGAIDYQETFLKMLLVVGLSVYGIVMLLLYLFG